eukprot:m.155138 g.155138  ORF g.155138 m.155138 type:complete len:83 (+) comp16407_c0_seq6:513-761(+)
MPCVLPLRASSSSGQATRVGILNLTPYCYVGPQNQNRSAHTPLPLTTQSSTLILELRPLHKAVRLDPLARDEMRTSAQCYNC